MSRRSGLLWRLADPLIRLGRRVLAEWGDDADLGASAAASSPPSLTDDSFTMALQQLLREDAGRFGTKLQVISLVEFREAVGDKWPRIADKVMMIAEGIIHLHIGPGNVFGRQGQDFFVLVFRTCDAREARRRAVMIAQDLGTRLIGSQFEGGQRPFALAAEVSLDGGVNPDGTLNLSAIQAAIGDVRSMIAAPSPGPAHGLRPHLIPGHDAAASVDGVRRSWLPGEVPTAGEGGLRYHMRPSDVPYSGDARDFALRYHMKPEDAPPASAEDSGPRAWMRPTTPPPPPAEERAPQKAIAAISEWKPISDTRRSREPQWTPMTANGSSRDKVPPLPGDARLTLLWRPTWTSEGEVIGTYAARIQRVDAKNQVPLEGCHAYPVDDAASAHGLDRFTVATAMRELGVLERGGNNRSTLLLPLHWDSLSSPRRMEICAPFADFSPAVRKARLVIEIFGVPDTVRPQQLAETITAMRPLCREVAVRGRLTAPHATLAAECGAAMAGVDLAELRPADHTDDARLLTMLGGLLESVTKAGLAPYVFGVRRRKVVIGAVHMGFALVNGPALMKDLPRASPKVVPAPRSRFALPT